MFKLQKILLILIILLTTGCSAIKESIGNNKIETGISIYNRLGVTESSFENISQGVEYLPQSSIGIENLKKQYADLILEKEATYLKREYTRNNISRLKLYLYASEKVFNLSSKVESLKTIQINFPLERERFTGFSNEYIRVMNSKNLSRVEKIVLLEEYEGLARYSNSSLLRESISRLKDEVTVKYYTTLNNKFNSRDYDLRYIFGKVATDSYRNRSRNYTEYRGNFEGNYFLTSKDKIIQVDISTLNFNSLKSELLKKDDKGNHLVYREEKELVLRGYYRELVVGTFYRKDLETFEFRKRYHFEIEKNGLNITISKEKEVVEDILEDIFKEILNYKLPELVNRSSN